MVAQDQETDYDRSKSGQAIHELSSSEKANIQRIINQSHGSVSFTESRRDKLVVIENA